jgi:CO/xanthine dehydrogenase FAD-binding subunit
MITTLKSFQYFHPNTVEEAVQILNKYGDRAKVLAGGTDLIPSMKRQKIAPQYMVYINDISQLKHIDFGPEEGLRIGALVSHRSIASSSIIREKFQLLAKACNKVGTPHVRRMGTIGGNICMAGPSQDTIPALLVLEAQMKVISLQGERIIPVDEFFTGPFQIAISGEEIVTEIQIPFPPSGSVADYQWVTKRTVVDETLVGVAALLGMDLDRGVCKEARIALGSVGPTPFRAREAEEIIRGEKLESKLIEAVAQAAVEETKPRSRADYRRREAGLLVKSTLEHLWSQLR